MITIEDCKTKLRSDINYSLRRYFVDTYFIKSIAGLASGSEVLDIGGVKVGKRGMFDISQYDLKVKYANLSAKTQPDFLCDVAHIPVEDAQFDCVVMGELLEHVPDPKSIIAEAKRVLKPGGTMIITTPFMFHLHADPYDYARYTDYWYQEYLGSIGLENIEIEKQGMYYSVLANMLRLWVREGHDLKHKVLRPVLLRFGVKALSLDYAKGVLQHPILAGHTTGFGIKCMKPLH